VLSGVVEQLIDGTSLFFCTPKISQHLLVVKAFRELCEKYGLDLRAVDLVGKKHLCSDELLREKESDGFYELCKKKRRRKECGYYGNICGYSYSERIKAKSRVEKLNEWFGISKHHHEVLEYCLNYSEGEVSYPLCGYEASLILAEEADLIVCDYSHLFSPVVAQAFLEKTRKKLEDCIVVVDEAHNLPERVREAMSSTINLSLVRRARNEALLMGNKILDQQLQKVEKTLKELEKELTEKQVEERIAHVNEVPFFGTEFLEDLYSTGLMLLENTHLHKSNLLKLHSFYLLWLNEGEEFVKIAKRTSRGASLSQKCLDPSLLTSGPFNSAKSTILMSGTLKPGTAYRDLLGLEKHRTIIKEYLSPFPEINRRDFIINGVTTKYEKRTDEQLSRIALTVEKILLLDLKTAVFFPSYDLLKKILEKVNTSKPIFVQEEGMSPSKARQVLEEFKSDEDAVLFGVLGGSFSEGVDFPGKELECVVIVGIPLKEPSLETKALIDYYDLKFGKGWEYGYILPAMTKAIQASGRLIRTELDSGLVFWVDERYSWRKYSKYFPSHISPRVVDFSSLEYLT